jgi:type IV secretion system protein VirB2
MENIMKSQLINLWKASIFAVLSLFLLFSAPLHVENAHASSANTTDPITNILCNAVNLVTGNAGRAICVLVIISMGIMLFLGKVTWGLAIMVAVGMGVLFGANSVVTTLSGGQSPCGS